MLFFFYFQVLRNKGVYENVKFVQQQNFWVGPSSASVYPSIFHNVIRGFLKIKSCMDVALINVMLLLSSRRRWSTWEPSFLLACGRTRRSTSWCRRKEQRRENRAAAWGTTAPAVCRLYRTSVRSANNNFVKLGMNLINVPFFHTRLQTTTIGLTAWFVCTIEHPCCVGEVASTSQCSFSPRFVTAARCSLPSGSQVSQKELSNFYTSMRYSQLSVLTLSFYFGRICVEPASVSPHEWPDDITKWPVSVFTWIDK